VLEQLREAVRQRYAPMGSQPATVRLFSADERGRSGAVDAAGELVEGIPGHRLFVAAEPSRLTSPLDWLLSSRALDSTITSKALRDHDLARTPVRHAQFLRTLATYGERSSRRPPSARSARAKLCW
jgi:hypothetical protein